MNMVYDRKCVSIGQYRIESQLQTRQWRDVSAILTNTPEIGEDK